MHDLRWIRDHPQDFDKAMARRGVMPGPSEALLALDEEKRACVSRLQILQTERNTLAKAVGHAKAQGEDPKELFARTSHLKQEIPTLEAQERELTQKLDTLLAGLPNTLEEDVPEGDETCCRLERSWGTPRHFTFPPESHFVLGERLGLMDFEGASRMSGARFVVLKGDLVRLERALATFMLDLHEMSFGYMPVSPPFLVKDEALFGTGQLPKFSQDLFQTTDGRWLIPTAEVPLTNLVREQVLEAKDLPQRYVAYTPCFRSEAGAAGRDTRGMMRHHQFHKVELVSITLPDASAAEHERMVGAAEEVLKRLELPYRVMTLASGDTGATAQKTYDLEVWLPGENTYREISSCSNTGAYQARRMKARYRTAEKGHKPALDFVHTLNGSGVAVGRALVAVLENYQQKDGSITIPDVLRPYMGGQEEIHHV